MASSRMTANPIRAPRHRPGKEVVEENSDSESDQSEQEEVAPPPTRAVPKYANAKGISSDLGKLDIAERRRLAAEAEATRVKEEQRLRAAEEEGFVTEDDEDEAASEEGSGEEEESSSEEESSEDEAPRRLMARPTFIKKSDRQNGTATKKNTVKEEEERVAREEAARLKAADEIVEEQIRKDQAAKAAGKKNWDDDEDEEDDVDDTDDLDVEAEIAAWKLRELRRIKRDREAIELREKELEEIERRKNLTEEERAAEDEEHLAKQKAEQEGKGKMAFMQKYHHKGAFFQDDMAAAGLLDRDIMGARFADDVQNRELLPQSLQIRDQTKIGKRGATKYKDLKSEDTGRWGQFNDFRPRAGDSGMGAGFGGDERFMSDRDRERFADRSGANNIPVGERKRASSKDRDQYESDKRRRVD